MNFPYNKIFVAQKLAEWENFKGYLKSTTLYLKLWTVSGVFLPLILISEPWPSNSEQFPFLKRWNPFSGSKVMSLLAPGTLPNLTALPQLVLHRRGLDTVMIRLDTVRVRMYAMKNYSLFPLDLHCTVYWLYTVQSLWCTRYPLLMQLCVVQRISWKMCLGCGNMCVPVLKKKREKPF